MERSFRRCKEKHLRKPHGGRMPRLRPGGRRGPERPEVLELRSEGVCEEIADRLMQSAGEADFAFARQGVERAADSLDKRDRARAVVHHGIP
jgi:hypothetical protein